MGIIDKLNDKVIKVPLVSSEKYAVIDELIEVLNAAGALKDKAAVTRAVLDREALGSTGLGEGIAVPHAKTPDVSELALAVGISEAGVDFQSLDGKPAHLFFLIIAPPDQAGLHVQALTEIAAISKSKTLCRMLAGTRNAEEVLELLQDE